MSRPRSSSRRGSATSTDGSPSPITPDPPVADDAAPDLKDELAYNDTIVCQLRLAISQGGHGIGEVPALIKEILRSGAWRHRKVATGSIVDLTDFREFVRKDPLEGLGASLDLVRRLIEDDPEAMDMLDRALGSRQGERTDLVDIVNEVVAGPDGNSAQYALRRLRDARPDLHAEVLAGALTPHAAMVAAGFRRRTYSIDLGDAAVAARAIRRHASPEFVADLVRALSVEDG